MSIIFKEELLWKNSKKRANIELAKAGLGVVVAIVSIVYAIQSFGAAAYCQGGHRIAKLVIEDI